MSTDTGRTIVVTGAASGIGTGVARALHDAGYRLILIDLDEARLKDAASEFAEATVVAADLSEPASTRPLTEAALQAEHT